MCKDITDTTAYRPDRVLGPLYYDVVDAVNKMSNIELLQYVYKNGVNFTYSTPIDYKLVKQMARKFKFEEKIPYSLPIHYYRD